VLDEPIYAKNIRHDSLSNDDMKIYSLFRKIYQLNVIQWQSEDSFKQYQFRDILMRLHDRDSTLDDWKTLSNHFIDSSFMDNE